MMFARTAGVMLLLACGIAAQSPTAKKFDEFGDLNLSDIAAHLDNYAVALQNEPQMKGFVIAYRTRRDLPGLSSSRAAWLRNYLIDNRGFPKDRIVTIDGGPAGCLAQELWLVPPGAAPTIRSDAYQSSFENVDASRKFFEATYDATNFESESYYFDISNSYEGFAEALRRVPTSFAYLIAYAGYRTIDETYYNKKGEVTSRRTRVIIQPVASARKRLREHRDILINEYKVPAKQIRTLFGGYHDWPTMELWIVPRGKPAPIPTPSIFLKGRR